MKWPNVSNETIGEIQIIISTICYGFSFVGQRYAMVDGKIGPITYNAARYGLSTILLLLTRPIMQYFSLSTSMKDIIAKSNENGNEERNKNEAKEEEEESEASEDNSLLGNGMLIWVSIAAISNYGGSMLQQISLLTVTATKAGFISGSYVVVVPFVEWLFPCFHAGRLTWKVWTGAFFCFVGLFFISGCTGFDTCLSSSNSWGEVLLLISVLFWVISVLSCDLATKRVDCLVLTIGEFVSVTVLTVITAVIFEPASFSQTLIVLRDNAFPIVFVAFTEAVAYFISTLGQMYVHPSRAAILYSGGEALSTCVLSYIFLGEYLDNIELFGGMLLLLSTLLSSSAAADEEIEEEEEQEELRRVRESEMSMLQRIGSFNSCEAISGHGSPVPSKQYSVQYFPLLDEVTSPILPQPNSRVGYGSV